MNDIERIQQEVVDEFGLFSQWEDKYEYLIDLGKEMPIIEEKYKIEENLIKGCQSRVWLHAEMEGDKLKFTADSDAMISKGIIALMIRVLSNQRPDDIINTPLTFIDRIGLKEHLSPTRSNGLVSMVKQIKLYAMAFKVKQQ